MISAIQEDIEKHCFEIRTDDEAVSVLEPKHYHRIVSAHRESFPELSRYHSLHIAKTGGSPRTLMHEVADWRNVNAHPPRDLDGSAVDRAVEAMVRLVRLFDSAAHDELSELAGKRGMGKEQQHGPDLVAEAEHEAKRILAKAEKQALAIRTQAQDQAKSTLTQTSDRQAAQSDLDAARKNIRVLSERARAIEAEAEVKANEIRQRAEKSANATRKRALEQRNQLIAEGERAAEQALEKARQDADSLVAQAHRQAKAIVAEAQAAPPADLSKAVHAPRDTARPTSQRTRANQRPSSQVRDVRSLFKPAKSGNGLVRTLRIDGWLVNCWVGTRGLTIHASVFSPSRRDDAGKWLEAQDEPLMGRDCSSEDEALEWLQQADTDGKIRREARRAIHLFESNAVDDGADDDIPF